jgi:hypothetical protein
VFRDGGINTTLPVGPTRYGVVAACIGPNSLDGANSLTLVVEGEAWEILCTGEPVSREFPPAEAGYVDIEPRGTTGSWYEALIQIPIDVN